MHISLYIHTYKNIYIHTNMRVSEWSGVEWSGVEWSGVEWSGVEWSGVEWSGVEWSGVEWSGVEWSGVLSPSFLLGCPWMLSP